MATTLVVARSPELVHRFIRLHTEAQRAGQVAVQRAYECGCILEGLAPADRRAFLREVGVSERTAAVYRLIVKRWPKIQRFLQHAASPSIRAALAAAPGRQRAKALITYRTELDHLPPEELTLALSSMRGRAATVTVKVKNTARPPAEHQLMLFE